MRRSVEVGASALLLVLALSLNVRSQDKKDLRKNLIPPSPTRSRSGKEPEGEKKPDQEKKPEGTPAPAVQQDRIDIGANLDSWYKIIQGADGVGYVHEVLQRAQAGNPWRYRYDADSEVELLTPDPKDSRKNQTHTESMRIRAQLDDTYAPITMERTDNRDEAQVMTSVFTEEAGKKIEVVLGPTERKSHPSAATRKSTTRAS
jgi:hypothetical protein